MKRLFTILLFLSFFFSQGQQLPHYSLYMLNEVIVNPAALSLEKENKITFMLRDQWNSFEGAPATQSISYNHLNHRKYKRGISIMNDVTGPISIINATLSASYSLKLQEKDKLAVGASASLMQYKIDNSQITLEDDGVFDPALYGGVDKATGSSLALGAYYYHPKYYIGLSMPNILGSSLNISDDKDNNKLENHYYVNGGVNINISNNNKIIPSFMLKKIGALPVQFDLNLRGVYNDLLWGGLSYRTGDAVVALFGVDYGQSSFGYSYDITTSTMRIPSAGTHSLVFSYRFNTKDRDRDNDGVLDEFDKCPKIPGLLSLEGCPDRDKDGIRDSEDNCPDDYGLKINDGCPDKDSDGVIDLKDKCPEIPGLAKFEGCPDTDGDGLQDKYDDCPEEPGPIINKGCPKGPSVDTIYITRVDTVFVTINKEVIKTDTVILSIPVSDLKQVFKYVKFASDKYILTNKSKLILDKVANYMLEKTYLNIKLTGHTDSQNTEEYNMKLSENRVKAVRAYLVSKQVNISRISIDWKGESIPIADNNTSAGREENRRVEIDILNEK